MGRYHMQERNYLQLPRALRQRIAPQRINSNFALLLRILACDGSFNAFMPQLPIVIPKLISRCSSYGNRGADNNASSSV